MDDQDPMDSGFADYYNPEEETKRSVDAQMLQSLGGWGDAGDSLGGFKPSDKASLQPLAAPAPFQEEATASTWQLGRRLPAAQNVWFEANNRAQDLPADPWFKLEMTTFFVRSTPASEIGNQLLRIFDAEATSAVSKVSPSKLCFKVDAECQGFTCEVKVRIYRLEDTRHAVEFQNRMGSSVLFNCLYERVSKDSGAELSSSVTAVAGGVPLEPLPATELVMLPLLKFSGDVEALGFPGPPPAFGAAYAQDTWSDCEPVLLPLLSMGGMHDEDPLPGLCQPNMNTEYWGPLALTVS